MTTGYPTQTQGLGKEKRHDADNGDPEGQLRPITSPDKASNVSRPPLYFAFTSYRSFCSFVLFVFQLRLVRNVFVKDDESASNIIYLAIQLVVCALLYCAGYLEKLAPPPLKEFFTQDLTAPLLYDYITFFLPLFFGMTAGRIAYLAIKELCMASRDVKVSLKSIQTFYAPMIGMFLLLLTVLTLIFHLSYSRLRDWVLFPRVKLDAGDENFAYRIQAAREREIPSKNSRSADRKSWSVYVAAGFVCMCALVVGIDLDECLTQLSDLVCRSVWWFPPLQQQA